MVRSPSTAPAFVTSNRLCTAPSSLHGEIVSSYLHVAGKSQLLPERMEKQRITRSHGIRDRKNGRLRRLHLPVAYPRSDLASLRYPSPQRFWITGRLQPIDHTCRLFQGRLDTSSAKR